jgi:hypothetical protein
LKDSIKKLFFKGIKMRRKTAKKRNSAKKKPEVSKRPLPSATWLETVGSYKGTAKATKERAKSIMGKFMKKYEDLQKCERN